MRTTWNGSLTFGLVSIPVGLAPATKPAARQSDVSFRLLHREDLTPIKQKRWCPVHDRELAPDEIVKGWEASKGNFVVVEDAELEALEKHDDSRSIEISQFVDLEQVDPIWRDRVYYLVPGSTAAQRRPYKLLLEAMRETGTGALGRFVRSGRESLASCARRGDALVLETLYLSEDVYSDAEITEAVEETEVEATGAGARPPDHRRPRRRVRSRRAEELLPERPAALLEAKLDGQELPPPERAGAAAGARRRPSRRAQGERRGCEDGPERRRPAKERQARREVAREGVQVESQRLECLPARETLQRVRRIVLGGLGDGHAQRLHLCLEEVLVDLALVNRDALLDAELDDRIAVHAELVRELLGRQVIRHSMPPLVADAAWGDSEPRNSRA